VSNRTLAPHPFIYGRPVRPGEFLDREAELRTIFNRLRNCESTAIVGEPHIGKTSLLFQLADQDTQHTYLGNDARCLVVSLLDLHSIGSDYTPTDFWKEALALLEEHPRHRTTARRLEQAAEAGYARFSLDQLFDHLCGRGQRLVLLLDGVHRLLSHHNFRDPAFFSLLRSLSTCTGGLALVVATHLSVAEMNEWGRDLLQLGSPLFDHMIELRLRSFDEGTANVLLGRIDIALSSTDRRFIHRVTGCHPFLLQTMAAILAQTAGYDRQVCAAETFYGQVFSYFNDLWHALDDRIRTAAVILSLLELGTRAQGHDFDYSEIKHVDTFVYQLRQLAKAGLAEQADESWQFDQKYLCFWPGERWRIRVQAFSWWVYDMFLAGTQASNAQIAGRGPTRRTLSRDLLTELRQILVASFDEEELYTLCFDLGIRYDDLSGKGTAGRARELIAYLERHKRICELIGVGRHLRPDVHWPHLPEAPARLSRGMSACEEWLTNKRYRVMLRDEQWDRLVTAVRNDLRLTMWGVDGLARELFEELRGRQ
jgi:hypothetical protein